MHTGGGEVFDGFSRKTIRRYLNIVHWSLPPRLNRETAFLSVSVPTTIWRVYVFGEKQKNAWRVRFFWEVRHSELNQDFRRDKNSPFPPRVSTGRETLADGINTESGTERVAPRGMTRRRRVGITWETEETREVARFVSPPDKSAKLGDDVWGERERGREKLFFVLRMN